MQADEFLTLAGPGHAQTRVLGSRFLGSALPAADLEAVSALLEAERKRYHDATHWCWAARVGVGKELIEKSADAGEPHGTAGMPILREMQKRNVTNSLVIVTRWFGGTKLGTGNLARAYGECAALALDAAPVRRELILARLQVMCPFDDQGTVYALAHRYQATVESKPSMEAACFVLSLAPAVAAALAAVLAEEGRGRIRVETLP